MKKLLTILLTFVLAANGFLQAQGTFPVNGIIDKRHLYYAFTNATIFVDYRTRLDSAILLIKDGYVVEVGKKITIPAGTAITDLKGKFIYPSFIDLFSDYGLPETKKPSEETRGPQFLSGTKGPFGWNQAIKPEQKAADLFTCDNKKEVELMQIGFGAVLSHKKDGIARGTAVFLNLGQINAQESIINPKAAACYSFDKGNSTQDYPGSLMGSIALLRQTFLDGVWYNESGFKKEVNLSLQAWNENLQLPQLFEVKDKYSVLRADKIGDEFGVNYIIKGAGDEYQRIKEIKEAGNQLIIPVNFPEPFDVTDPYEADHITLAEMKNWELAPGNAASLFKAGITFAFTASDLKNKKDFLKNIRLAINAGLPEEEALKACTYTPAHLVSAGEKSGNLKTGSYANFIITSAGIFDKSTVIYENWSAGKKHVIKEYATYDVRGDYELVIDNLKPFQLKITGTPEVPLLNLQEDTVKIKVNFSENENVLLFSFELKKAVKGMVRLNGSFSISTKTFEGNGQLPDGRLVNWSAKYVAGFIKDSKSDSSKKDSANIKPVNGNLLFPNMAYGFKELPVAKTVLFKNVTVWTNEKEGIISNADVLIQQGKIVKVGKNLDANAFTGVEVIDGSGKHLTAGIIDEHSHIAISGDVNECTQSVTAEVRIGDVVDGDDINIYRQLSGGVTSAHLLHGSCNPVGGQSQLIKLRWGMTPEKMKFANWDGFIKFALGENVKQSNWGDLQTTRYPQTRMGVEQVYVQAFGKAREYEIEWKKFNQLPAKEKARSTAPRKDLEMETLVEILNKKRFITCHSYQQGEINMLMHVADSFGFKVNTFTHILEGYKVADKMKKHGVGASSFSDWWAYKFEVIEAIPYNGAILHDMGVVSAFNSDDAEMARRLNQEAAKAVKYGKVSEEEALKFVTLNPAKLLHVDDRTGSIKENKDADLVLWTDNPLSIYAKVVMTFVDGVCYFDAARDLKIRQEITNERATLIQKMISEKNKGTSTQQPGMSIKEIHHCIDHEDAEKEKSVY